MPAAALTTASQPRLTLSHNWIDNISLRATYRVKVCINHYRIHIIVSNLEQRIADEHFAFRIHEHTNANGGHDTLKPSLGLFRQF